MNYKTKKCKFPPLSFLYFLKGEDRTCKMQFNFDFNEVLDPGTEYTYTAYDLFMLFFSTSLLRLYDLIEILYLERRIQS